MPLESPKTHFAFAKCTQWEVDFITEIVRQTGCSLLLDVNNVHVASTNRKWDSFRYIDAYPLAAVRETHLAGHAREVDEKDRSLLIDIHDRPVEEISVPAAREPAVSPELLRFVHYAGRLPYCRWE